MSVNLARERILVTGGAGFLGRQVVGKLIGQGADWDRILVPRRRDHAAPGELWVDLRDRACTNDLFVTTEPSVVIHLAADCGGIQYNRANPGRLFHDNMAMGLNVIDCARLHQVKKIVVVGTVCAYPENPELPFREADLWAGYPEPTNAYYGVAKRALAVMLAGYEKQYGLRSAYLLPANLYGPHDSFGPERSHVIPAIIRKFCRAVDRGFKTVTLWGSGQATREFLHVDDCARAVVWAAKMPMGSVYPINIGTGQEISIRELAVWIASIVEFTGKIRWDRSKPDGQPARCLDTTRAEKLLKFKASIPLHQGIKQTIKWWRGQE